MSHKKKFTNTRSANPLKIQHFLGGINYPAAREDLLNKAKENGAPRDVLNVLERIMDKVYSTPAEVTKYAANPA